MSLPDPPPAPLIDPRTYADLVAQTAKLARAYSDWAPDLKTGPDPGETLIALFGKMMVQVLARLNQVPEKHHLAFLNLVGAQLLPGQAATAPLTFKAAAAVGKEVAVPAGTRVGASTKGPGGEDLFFATVAPLAVTPAALVAVIAHAPDVDKFADLRAALLAASPLPTTLSSGAQPIEHCLFIGSELFADWAGISGITLTLVLDAPLGALPIEWRVHGPEGFTALPATVSSTAATSAIWTIQIDCPLANDLFVVNGQSGRWLQGRWTPALDAGSVNPPAITDIDLVVQRRALPIDLALTNTIPIDLGRDFAPFGERPRFNDACYFACHAAFGIPSSELTLVVTLTDAPPTGSPTPTANLVLAWEVLGADGWTELGRSGPGLGPDSDSKFDGTRAFTQSGTVTLVLPAGRSTGVCGGVANYWLRVRIVKGDYGSELTVTADASGLPVIQSATLKPPWVKSLRADVKSHRAAAALTLATLNDFSLRNHGTPSVGAPLSAFRKRQSPVSAWYLGFDQPFGGRDHGLYIDVTSAANAVPPLVWEYLDATGWQACAVEDGTYS